MDDRTLYVWTCSEISRQNFLLARLDQCSALRKRIMQLLAEWVEAEAYARLTEIVGELQQHKADADTRTLSVDGIVPDRLDSH